MEEIKKMTLQEAASHDTNVAAVVDALTSLADATDFDTFKSTLKDLLGIEESASTSASTSPEESSSSSPEESTSASGSAE